MIELDRNSKISLQQQISEVLESEIAAHLYHPGVRLPSVRELGRKFGVSHETGKAAVMLLEKKGLVEIIPSKGAFVVKQQQRKVKESGLIAVIIDNGEGTTPKDQLDTLFGHILKEIHNCVEDYGWHPVSSYVSINSPQSRAKYLELLEKVDGVICINLIDEEIVRIAQMKKLPIVSVLPAIVVDDIDVITIDYFRTYYLVTKSFIEAGVRHLSYMEHIKPFDAAQKRYQGVAHAVEEAVSEGIPVTIDRINVQRWEMPCFQKAVAEWLLHGTESELLFCANDNMALAALKELQQAGCSIPGSIMVVGSRNTPMCELIHPTLSSIDYQYSALITLAMERLQLRLQSNTGPATEISLKGKLISRESSHRETSLQESF